MPVRYGTGAHGYKNPGGFTVGGNLVRAAGDLVLWGWFGDDAPPRVSTSKGIALPQAVWVEVQSPAGYTAELSLVLRQGRLVCSQMSVTAEPEAGTVVERLVIDMRLDELIADVAAAAAWVETTADDGSIIQRRATEADHDRIFNAVRDPQSRNIAVPDLREVADLYRSTLADAKARGEKIAKPTKEISERWHVSRATASRWVRDARNRGLLSETTERKAGG